MNHAEFDEKLKALYAEAYWSASSEGELVVPWVEVLSFINNLNEEHRMELSDMSQIAYADGLHDGQNQ